MRKTWLVVMVLVLMTAAIGCGDTSTDPGDADDIGLNPEETVVLVTPNKGESELSLREITELESITLEIERDTDDGPEEFEITGVTLDAMAEAVDVDPATLEGLILVAGDGYSVEVSAEVLSDHEAVFAYYVDGEALSGDSAPLRAFFPGSETMYWVRNLVRIEFIGSAERAVAASEIYLLETLFATMEEVDYGGEAAVRASDILEYAKGEGRVFMAATDGFEKSEGADIFSEHFVVTTGDTAPAFRGEELPRGMHVRDLVWLTVGETAFYSAARGGELLQILDVENASGVSLVALVDAVGLAEVDALVLEAVDGYSVEIGWGDLSRGVIYIRDSGEVSVAFDDLPRSANVRDLLRIGTGE